MPLSAEYFLLFCKIWNDLRQKAEKILWKTFSNGGYHVNSDKVRILFT